MFGCVREITQEDAVMSADLFPEVKNSIVFSN
ncbi:hypothetical protein FBBNIHIM_02615 [Pseudocitrobacter vendiensis]|uniref:Uncharacterized protein n=1 Tax=Pseudocitrobacter vendiensis TaxID=2488306 RepID=A0ABN8T685_9ENTR|nr:hypothetical protein FBBNIHIM_02615 [Pseudocitrobacter vendiensis]